MCVCVGGGGEEGVVVVAVVYALGVGVGARGGECGERDKGRGREGWVGD